MKHTKLIYLTNSYLKSTEAKIVNVTTAGVKPTIILDQTIFYPQGGGQPSDGGVIEGQKGKLSLTSVRYGDGVVEHSGVLTGELNVGDHVSLALDWDRRYKHMQLHTAGHLIDEAMKSIVPEFRGIKGLHGINNENYIEFNGFVDSEVKKSIETWLNEAIMAKYEVTTEMVTKQEIADRHLILPYELPTNKPLRLIKIGDADPVPDGGTQLKNTGELWPITIGEFEYIDGHTKIRYQVKPPELVKTVEPTTKPTPTDEINLKEFKSRLASVTSNTFKDTAKLIVKLPPQDRKEGGQLLNALKIKLDAKVIEKTDNPTTAEADQKSENHSFFDVTLPGTPPTLGHIHPISHAINRITHIFENIGFTRVRYPEVEWDKYAFENLNMAPDHPARDEWETFFIDTPIDPKMGQMVLTPHTSNGQTREMERLKKPPIRMLNIGKCYRKQQDVTHTAMFHQFEGLVVDKGINIQHLKGVLDYFAAEFYGSKAKSRIRPFHFQFTEPSFEVDFSCVHCDGIGCRFCKSGWHEVGGAGMVHPNVLRAGGIDPEEYTGFAFGWGVERVYTLQPGLELDDIRPLYSNNLDFLSNF